MNRTNTWIHNVRAAAVTFWRRSTEPLVPVDDLHIRRTLTSQAAMLLMGAMIFTFQLAIRFLGFFSPTPFAVFALTMAIGFTLTGYVLARRQRLNSLHAMAAASILIYVFTIALQSPHVEVLYYPSLLVLFSVIHTEPRQAALVFVMNTLGIVGVALLVPGLSSQIADPLTLYLIMSGFIFVFMHHYRLKIRFREEERRQREEDRLRLALQAEQQKVVERFVRALSHYFRNQLAIIEANRYVIPRVAGNAEQLQDRVDKIGDSITHMREQLDNLRLIITIDTAQAVPFNVNPVIEALGHDFQSAAQKRNLLLITELDPAPPIIMASDSHLKNAISQLVMNALIHTKPGGQITLKTAQHDQRVEITVQDTGSGIDTNRQSEMFDFFYKGDTARSLESGGIGLGLSIVKMVAEVYRGEVRVTSAIGEGSTFTMQFPSWDGHMILHENHSMAAAPGAASMGRAEGASASSAYANGRRVPTPAGASKAT